jgi:hypothetical protein
MPTLYKIVTEVRKISESTIGQITKIYITGLGTAINNIDLYFQEYIANAKCELLKPFFLENVTSIKVPIKDYIEVNSATALALDGLGYGDSNLNFRSKGSSLSMLSFDSKKISAMLSSMLDPKKELEAIDKTMLRFVACLCVAILGYGIISSSIVKQIDEKQADVTKATQAVTEQISQISSDISKINSGKSSYDSLVSTLTALNSPEETEDNTSGDYSSDNSETEVTIEKNAIPNLLNRIVYVIPTQVKITSIKNTENRHIVIEAQAAKYDQLGYFRAALSTSGYLDNVKSTSGTKSGDTVLITIEGDLP